MKFRTGDRHGGEARSGSWMRTPLVYPQSLLLIGSVLLALQFVSEILKALKGFKHSEGEKS